MKAIREEAPKPLLGAIKAEVFQSQLANFGVKQALGFVLGSSLGNDLAIRLAVINALIQDDTKVEFAKLSAPNRLRGGCRVPSGVAVIEASCGLEAT
jgi:hypothetical protein